MAAIKGLFARVRKLEPKLGKVQRVIGSIEQFDAEMQAGIKEGRYDPVDMPVAAYCLRRWVEQDL